MLIYDVFDFILDKNSWALVNAGTWYQDPDRNPGEKIKFTGGYFPREKIRT